MHPPPPPPSQSQSKQNHSFRLYVPRCLSVLLPSPSVFFFERNRSASIQSAPRPPLCIKSPSGGFVHSDGVPAAHIKPDLNIVIVPDVETRDRFPPVPLVDQCPLEVGVGGWTSSSSCSEPHLYPRRQGGRAKPDNPTTNQRQCPRQRCHKCQMNRLCAKKKVDD